MTNIIPELNNFQIEKIDLEEFLEFLNLDSEVKAFLQKACELAKKRKEFLYFAGGVVRDYFLRKNTKDFDLVLEGNLEDFLKELFKEVRGEILFKSQFLTYKVNIEGNSGKTFIIDLVTARRELYEAPATLPKVFPSSFKEDILRRDFTINTLILGLTPPYEGKLLDLLGGKRDLEKGIIRPLHLFSFVEDPTRIFRGIRYKVRFNFEWSEEFYQALNKAFEISSLEKLTGSRIYQELKLYLLKESLENLKDLLELTYDLGVFEKVGLKLKRERFLNLVKWLEVLEKELTFQEKEKVFFWGLIWNSSEGALRLGLSIKELNKFKASEEFIKSRVSFLSKMGLSEKVEFLEKVPFLPLLVLSLFYEDLKEEVLNWIKVYRKIKPKLTGEELKKMGISESPKIGKILKFLRDKHLEGKIRSEEEEKQLVEQLLEEESFLN
ncbi:MAG: hypothetical protein N3A56_03655 [Thermodesulfobacteriaceae bacterium]|nr:hypothetical protein [Caldimicrobium sp.]MCX8041569.1 hypothetical protein [Thermodesulfobacteriaceae bacterium]MDW8136090.1 hypothetical protein [Thermodesulfobacterium sp.]